MHIFIQYKIYVRNTKTDKQFYSTILIGLYGAFDVVFLLKSLIWYEPKINKKVEKKNEKSNYTITVKTNNENKNKRPKKFCTIYPSEIEGDTN